VRVGAAAAYVAAFFVSLAVLCPLAIASIYILSLVPDERQSSVLFYALAIILTAIGVLLWRWIRMKLQASWGARV